MDPVTLFIANVVSFVMHAFGLVMQLIISVLNFLLYLSTTILQILHMA